MYVTSWVVAGVLMWLGARISGTSVGFFRAELAALAVTLVTWTVAGFLADSLGLLGFVAALCITLWIIKEVFETTWGAAIIVWLFNAVAQFGLVFIGWNTGVMERNLIPSLLH